LDWRDCSRTTAFRSRGRIGVCGVSAVSGTGRLQSGRSNSDFSNCSRLQSCDCSPAVPTPTSPTAPDCSRATAVRPFHTQVFFPPALTPKCSCTTAVWPSQLRILRFFPSFNSKLQSCNRSLAIPETPNTLMFSQLQATVMRLQSGLPNSKSSKFFPASTPNCSCTTAVWVFQLRILQPYSQFQVQTAVARLQSSHPTPSPPTFYQLNSELQSHDCSLKLGESQSIRSLDSQTAVARLQFGVEAGKNLEYSESLK